MSNFANPELENSFLKIILASNTPSAPAVVFANDLTKGLYWDIDGLHLTGLSATPTDNTEAASKAYVDNQVGGSGVSSIHADSHSNLTGDVQFISGTNITLSQSGQAITVNASGGGSSFPLLAPAGSLSNPNYSSAATPDSGLDFGLTAAGDIDLIFGGATALSIGSTSNGATLTGRTLFTDWFGLGGAAAADVTTGLFGDISYNTVSLAIQSTEIGRFTSTGLGIKDTLSFSDFTGSFGLAIGATTSPTTAVELFSSSCDFSMNDTLSSLKIQASTGAKNAVLILGTDGSDGSTDGTITIQSLGASLGSPGDSHPNNSAQFDHSVTATETRFLLYDVDSGSLQRVTVGAADSGGTGFKVLRIPN